MKHFWKNGNFSSFELEADKNQFSGEVFFEGVPHKGYLRVQTFSFRQQNNFKNFIFFQKFLELNERENFSSKILKTTFFVPSRTFCKTAFCNNFVLWAERKQPPVKNRLLVFKSAFYVSSKTFLQFLVRKKSYPLGISSVDKGIWGQKT